MAWRIRRWSALSEALCRWAIAADRISAQHDDVEVAVPVQVDVVL
jgi:hypothetical protein